MTQQAYLSWQNERMSQPVSNDLIKFLKPSDMNVREIAFSLWQQRDKAYRGTKEEGDVA